LRACGDGGDVVIEPACESEAFGSNSFGVLVVDARCLERRAQGPHTAIGPNRSPIA